MSLPCKTRAEWDDSNLTEKKNSSPRRVFRRLMIIKYFFHSGLPTFLSDLRLDGVGAKFTTVEHNVGAVHLFLVRYCNESVVLSVDYSTDLKMACQGLLPSRRFGRS